MQDVSSNINYPNDALVWLILILLNLCFCCLCLLIFVGYKKKKGKEDFLIIEKQILNIVIFLYISIFIMIQVINNKNNTEYNPSSTGVDTSFVSIFLISDTTLKSAIMLEDHFIKVNPTYLLNSLIKKVVTYTYEVLLFFFIGVFFLTKLIDGSNPDIKIDKHFLFCDSLAVAALIIAGIIINIIILLRQVKILGQMFEKKSYTRYRLFLDFFCFILYVIFGIFYIIVLIWARISKEPTDFSLIRIFTWYFVCYILLENLLFLVKIYFSDFYYYTLSNTYIKNIFFCFPENHYKRPLLYSSEVIIGTLNKNSAVIFFHDYLNFSIDEVILQNFDFVLNCINSSLNKVFESANYNFPSSDELKKEESKKVNITDSKLINLIPKQNNVFVYQFGFNDFTDDKLTNMFANRDKLEITLTSYYQKSFEKLIKEKNINIKALRNSMLAHALENGTIASLLDKNCKEAQFINQKSLIIRTLDKQYGLEFVDDNFFKKITFFKKYIRYLRQEKNSFVPSILGIYKIKINGFREISFILVKNNFVEEFPKDFFNYWQIIRLSADQKIELLSTSKERQSLLITEEPILNNLKKLNLIEYHTFNEILTKDLNFLKLLQIVNFSIIFLYYEISNESPKDNYSLEDEKRSDKPRENDKLKEKDKNNLSVMNRISAVKFRTSNQLGNDFSYENSIKLDLSNLQDGKGFEAINNNLKSMIFFNFENVFQSFSYFENQNIYKDFKSFLMSFFEEIFT